jgi:uncharacterized membrane protein
MTKSRLEAFSDGVIAIIITIMVLELRAPHGAGFDALVPLLPKFLSYVLSFVYVAIYWNNHHHLLHASEQINGQIMWANLHLLFWLSLVPFATAWMGENHVSPIPTALYGVVLLLTAIAWLILQTALLRAHGPRSRLSEALSDDLKGKISAALYVAAIPLAFVHQLLAVSLYVIVAVMWLVPDRRIESRVGRSVADRP